MSPRPVSSPPQIPGFQYAELLGMGGFADVFLYEQRSMGGRKVAVKVLLQGLRSDLQQAFEAEARAMARLSNHPSIVSVFDAGQTPDGRAYLVMEHCPGANLYTQLRSRPLNIAKALEIAIQIAGAVETAHAAGIIHRDIKPANILFTEFNRPALTDFGISASTTAGANKAVGVSVPWAPPEQLVAGNDTDVTGDVYSLAATLFTALTGHPPFWRAGAANDAMTMGSRIMNDPVPPLGRDDAPPSLQRVLEVAMSKQPGQRYPSALELARALQQVQLELHLPVTSADVRGEAITVTDDDDSEAGGTIAAGFVTIEATPTNVNSRSGSGFTGGTAKVSDTQLENEGLIPAVIRHGHGSAAAVGPLEFTGPAPLSLEVGETVLHPEEAQPQEDPPPPAPKRRAPLWAALVLVVVLVAVGVVVLVTRGASTTASEPARTTSASAKAVDPVGEIVPQVTDLKLTSANGRVVATWKNPDPKTGDKFLYQKVDPATPATTWTPVTDPTVTVDPIPGRTCVAIRLARANGRTSESATGCYPS